MKESRWRGRLAHLAGRTTWLLVVLSGLGMLGCAVAEVGPPILGTAGAVVVAVAYTVGLAARVGGRPLVYGLLALAMGVAVPLVDRPFLTNGAAVLTAVVSGVFAVMATVPAVRFAQAVREAVLAVLIAFGGAVAVVGFEPEVALARFEYTVLGASLVLTLLLVYRLGAGLHGLGRRGLVTVVVGGIVLAVTLAYAEALRRYGSPAMDEAIRDATVWMRSNLGAVPRPLQVLLGIPALVWGTHMRARRRQGWWVCAFGVAGTSSVAVGLMRPQVGLVDAALAEVYSMALGVVLGYLLVRLDLALTGSRGSRARRAEEDAAVRPEPPRTHAL